jgi:hypothetical protein
MQKISCILLFMTVVSINVKAQVQSTLDFKLGVGRAVLGTGDFGLYRFESELTKKWNKYVSSSLAINVGFGYSNSVGLRQANSLHADLNVFVSPFGNQRRNNFKIGTGITGIYANVTASQGKRMVYDEISKMYVQQEVILTETRRASGFSMIIEDEISVGTRYLLGIKIIVQPYSNADILSGANLKLGIKL